MGLVSPMTHAAEPALGSNEDRIRQMLFANEPLEVFAASIESNATGPFQKIVEASKFAKSGKKAQAIQLLQEILKEPELDTRLELYVWSFLREMGVKPDQRKGGEVLGVILEVPMENGCDTLAAYVDGSSRYLNYSGKAIFWDEKEAKIQKLCQALVDSTILASGKAKPRISLVLPKKIPQATLLTRSGIYQISNPPESVLQAGAELMMALMKKAQ